MFKLGIVEATSVEYGAKTTGYVIQNDATKPNNASKRWRETATAPTWVDSAKTIVKEEMCCDEARQFVSKENKIADANFKYLIESTNKRSGWTYEK
jgi:hypothetical protein